MTPKAIDRLAPDSQAIIALVSAFVAGTAVALTMAGWLQLPGKVEEQGDAIVAAEQAISSLQRAQRADSVKLERIYCIVSAQARGQDAIDRCGL